MLTLQMTLDNGIFCCCCCFTYVKDTGFGIQEEEFYSCRVLQKCYVLDVKPTGDFSMTLFIHTINSCWLRQLSKKTTHVKSRSYIATVSLMHQCNGQMRKKYLRIHGKSWLNGAPWWECERTTGSFLGKHSCKDAVNHIESISSALLYLTIKCIINGMVNVAK